MHALADLATPAMSSPYNVRTGSVQPRLGLLDLWLFPVDTAEPPHTESPAYQPIVYWHIFPSPLTLVNLSTRPMLGMSFPVIWLHHSLAWHPAPSQPRLASQHRDDLLPEELLSGLERLELADESGLDTDVPVLWGVSKLVRRDSSRRGSSVFRAIPAWHGGPE